MDREMQRLKELCSRTVFFQPLYIRDVLRRTILGLLVRF